MEIHALGITKRISDAIRSILLQIGLSDRPCGH